MEAGAGVVVKMVGGPMGGAVFSGGPDDYPHYMSACSLRVTGTDGEYRLWVRDERRGLVEFRWFGKSDG